MTDMREDHWAAELIIMVLHRLRWMKVISTEARPDPGEAPDRAALPASGLPTLERRAAIRLTSGCRLGSRCSRRQGAARRIWYHALASPDRRRNGRPQRSRSWQPR